MDLIALKHHALRWRDFFIELIYPEECLSCGREGEWLCRACARKIRINVRQACPGCNSLSDFGKVCPECRPKYFLKGIWVASSYDDKIVSGAIKSFKYDFVRELSYDLGDILSAFLRDLVGMHQMAPDKSPAILKDIRRAVFIPIPLHPRRERFRGFNQSRLLLSILADNFNLAVDDSSLVRVKYSKPQARLKPDKRLINIKDSFAWISDDLRGRKIVLIDDVATTGATLNEAAKVLMQSGAKEVWGLVVARG